MLVLFLKLLLAIYSTLTKNKSHLCRLEEQEQRELEQIPEDGDLRERGDGGGRGGEQLQGGGGAAGRRPAHVHRRAHLQNEAA